MIIPLQIYTFLLISPRKRSEFFLRMPSLSETAEAERLSGYRLLGPKGRPYSPVSKESLKSVEERLLLSHHALLSVDDIDSLSVGLMVGFAGGGCQDFLPKISVRIFGCSSEKTGLLGATFRRFPRGVKDFWYKS